MNIQYHIKSLLYRHDCVIVSGLGGFVCQVKSAQIVEEYIVPPSKQISFNQSLNNTDGLLENHVAKEEKISYQIAQQNILVFSQKLIDSLEEQQEVVLNGLGRFNYNESKKLVFTPESNEQWLINAYGLPKFKVSEIVKADKKIGVVAIQGEKEQDSTPTPNSKPAYWKYAAVGIIAIGIAGLIGAQVYQNNIETYNIAEQEKASKIIDQKIQQSSFMLTEPLKPIAVNITVEKPGKYHIVGGAFRIRANVDKKIKQLQQKGFDAKYIGENAYGLHQVVYASYTERSKALKALREIKAKENRSAWLFVKEL
jgi:nucleoid DNA-binding protein